MMRALAALLVLVGIAISAGAQAAWRTLAYDQEAAPVSNPLKGFVPYPGEYDFPHSMEFDYVGLDAVMSGQDTFTLSGQDTFTFDIGLEPVLNDIAGRGHQMVLRFYLDYPDFRNAVPRFLIDGGLQQTRYTSDGGGRSPNYEDENLVSALEAFIAALGARYDGDPRIGFLQAGLLGHWGEWHTYPDEHLQPSVATQNRILDAYAAAFARTRVLVSQDSLGYDPMAELTTQVIGFHDDDFANNTLPPGDDQFWSRMQRFGLTALWKTQPIGGEIQPDFQNVIWNVPSGAPENYSQAVDTTHVSWLINHGAFENFWTERKRERARQGARRTGYELYVSEVSLPDVQPGENLVIGVRIENRGVAPFYYDWPVEIGIFSLGKQLQTYATDWQLTTVIPGEGAREFQVEAAQTLALDVYTARMRVVNPLAGGRPLRFANATQGAEWLSLGKFGVGDVPGEGEGEGEGEDEEKSPMACSGGTRGTARVFFSDLGVVAAMIGVLTFPRFSRKSLARRK